MNDLKRQIWNGMPIPQKASVAALRNMIGSPGPEAWVAVRALADNAQPEALTALIELTASRDPHLRRAAGEAIGIQALGQSASDVVLRLLHDDHRFVVRTAIEAAVNLVLGSAHDQILHLAKTAEESTRLDALRALVTLWQPSDFEDVFQVYLHDRSDQIRKQAAWTLQQNPNADRWEQLFSAWSVDPIPRHRVWACQLAERFGSGRNRHALDALQNDKDGHVRAAAMRAVHRLAAR
jgi:HEAT repeat protein